MNKRIHPKKRASDSSAEGPVKPKSKKPERGFKFIKSAVATSDYPIDSMPEVALVGRSNAGKSSFLNAWAGRIIARVSSEPGKTRLLNFFEVDSRFRLVDMPGYGYAARARGEVDSWKAMIENYLFQRTNLRGLLLIMDIRRDWEEEEQMLAEFVQTRQLPLVVVLNKADKMSRSQALQRVKALQQKVTADVYCVSSMKKTNMDDVRNHVFKHFLSRNG